MEKLELKHLAPYLSYRLKCIDLSSNIFTVIHYEPKSQSKLINIGDLIFEKTIYNSIQNYKPILRPLSDLIRDEFALMFINFLIESKLYQSKFANGYDSYQYRIIKNK